MIGVIINKNHLSTVIAKFDFSIFRLLVCNEPELDCNPPVKFLFVPQLVYYTIIVDFKERQIPDAMSNIQIINEMIKE